MTLSGRVGSCWRRAAGVDPMLSGQLQRSVAFAPGRVMQEKRSWQKTMSKCLLKDIETYSDTFGKTQTILCAQVSHTKRVPRCAKHGSRGTASQEGKAVVAVGLLKGLVMTTSEKRFLFLG